MYEHSWRFSQFKVFSMQWHSVTGGDELYFLDPATRCQAYTYQASTPDTDEDNQDWTAVT